MEKYLFSSISQYDATFFHICDAASAALKFAIVIFTCCFNCFLHQLRKYVFYGESLMLLLMMILMMLVIVMVIDGGDHGAGNNDDDDDDTDDG